MASAEKTGTTLVDLTNENSVPTTSVANINFSLAGSAPISNRFVISGAKNESSQYFASVDSKKPRHNVCYVRNSLNPNRIMRPGPQFVFPVCNGYAASSIIGMQGNRPGYTNSVGRPNYGLGNPMRSTI